MSKAVKRNYRTDSLKMDQTYYTEEGYLVDHPVVTRCGIFEYSDPKAKDGIRHELRLPEEVFSEKSLASYEGKPVVITHDAGEINKNNVHEEQIGTILSKGYQDGNKVRCKIVIHNTDALKECGLRELSLGYSLNLDETPGMYHGQKYDAIQRDIEVNHLALVGEARAGDRARLNIDHKDTGTNNYLKGGPVMSVRKKGTKKVQGENRYDSDLTPEELEQAIAMFKAQREGAAADEEDVKMDAEEIINGVRERKDRRDSEEEQMDAEEVIAEQEGDIEALLSVIDELQAASDMSAVDEDDTNNDEDDPNSDEDDSGGNMDEGDPEENTDEDDTNEDEEDNPINTDSVDKAVDKRLRDYLDVCRVADRLNLDGVENMSLTNARKKVISAVNPKLRLDGKSDAYIQAAYDIAKQNVAGRKKVDMQRRNIMSKSNYDSMDSNAVSSAASAREKMIERREKKNGGKD